MKRVYTISFTTRKEIDRHVEIIGSKQYLVIADKTIEEVDFDNLETVSLRREE